MKDGDLIRQKLANLLANRAELAKESRTDFDAGRYDGIKEALAIVDQVLDRSFER
jgi:hypothetical protein